MVEMLRKVMVLVSGSSIAQLISFLSLPLLSRLYEPAQFGFFAIISSLCWFSAVFATFQLEHAIILPKLERTANCLVKLILIVGFLVAVCVSVFFCVVTFVVPSLQHGGVSPYVLAPLIFINIFGVVVTQALRALLVRAGQFRLVAHGAVVTAGVTALTAVLTAWLAGNILIEVGLVIAQGAGLLAAAFFWSAVLGRRWSLRLARMDIVRLVATFRRYRNFGMLLTASNAVKTCYGRMPTIIVSLVGGSVAAGLYGLVERVISAPTVLLAQAVGSVFRHKAGQFAKMQDTPQIILAYWKVVLAASLFVIPVFAVAGVFAPLLFKLVFGKEWEEAGTYASILLVGEAFVFVLAVVEDASILMGKNKYRLVWHLGQLVAISLILLLAYMGRMPGIEETLWALVIVRVLFSLTDLAFFYHIMLRYRNYPQDVCSG